MYCTNLSESCFHWNHGVVQGNLRDITLGATQDPSPSPTDLEKISRAHDLRDITDV